MVRVGVYRHAIRKSHHMRVILVGLFSGGFSVRPSVRALSVGTTPTLVLPKGRVCEYILIPVSRNDAKYEIYFNG